MPITLVRQQYTAAGVVSSRRTNYIHIDHLNTPRLMTDTANKLVWRWDGDAFGAAAPNQNPDGDATSIIMDLRFPGQYYDVETGLYYNINRYYDSTIGRYLQSDPMGEAGGVNLYGYVSGNPISLIDPLGLVELNLFPPSQPIHQNAQNYNSPPGIYSVGGHGSETSVYGSNGKKVSPEELAQMIRNDPNSEGKTVQLMSCNTGKGNNPYASKLSNALGSPVLAPNGYVGFSPAGDTAVNQSKNMSGATGRYNMFNP